MKRKDNSRSLSLLAGCAGLLALAPVPVLAALTTGCQTGPSYTEDKGVQTIILPLAPPEITLNKDSAPGSIVFEAPLQTFKFTCVGYPGRGGPSLHKGGSYDAFLTLLTKANLKLQIKINGKGPWVPGSPEFLPFTSDYTGALVPKTDDFPTGVFQLVLTKPVDRPVRVSLPATSDIIAVYNGNGSSGNNRIGIGTSNSTWVSAIPQCIGKTSVPAEIDLGRVITGGQGGLPSARQFYIKPSFNQECGDFGDVGSWTGFALNLSIQFEVANAGDLTSGNKAINLKNNGDTLNNGLQLVIKKNGASPVTFNKWEDIDQAISTTNNPLNLSYSASLESITPGSVSSTPTGKFSQQVTVKVRYK
ncbi:hypothetical protein XY32_002772 [Salmonella enterica subsp. enterica]|nr:hypothetical protein [Salmonella enterica subsp. enterica serovar Javiana]